MKIIFILMFLFITIPANATYYYLVDKNNKVIAVQDGPAKEANLIKDGFTQIESEDNIDLIEAEVKNNKISKHQKTTVEINKETEKNNAKTTVINKLKLLGFNDEEINLLLNRY